MHAIRTGVWVSPYPRCLVCCASSAKAWLSKLASPAAAADALLAPGASPGGVTPRGTTPAAAAASPEASARSGVRSFPVATEGGAGREAVVTAPHLSPGTGLAGWIRLASHLEMPNPDSIELPLQPISSPTQSAGAAATIAAPASAPAPAPIGEAPVECKLAGAFGSPAATSAEDAGAESSVGIEPQAPRTCDAAPGSGVRAKAAGSSASKPSTTRHAGTNKARGPLLLSLLVVVLVAGSAFAAGQLLRHGIGAKTTSFSSQAWQQQAAGWQHAVAAAARRSGSQLLLHVGAWQRAAAVAAHQARGHLRQAREWQLAAHDIWARTRATVTQRTHGWWQQAAGSLAHLSATTQDRWQAAVAPSLEAAADRLHSAVEGASPAISTALVAVRTSAAPAAAALRQQWSAIGHRLPAALRAVFEARAPPLALLPALEQPKQQADQSHPANPPGPIAAPEQAKSEPAHPRPAAEAARAAPTPRQLTALVLAHPLLAALAACSAATCAATLAIVAAAGRKPIHHPAVYQGQAFYRGAMSPPLHHFIALAVLSALWYVAGRAAQSLRLPLITGIMLAGAASGPHALGLLSGDGLASLTTVDHVCLSLIALAAGAELQLSELRKIRRQVTLLTLSISCCSWAAVFAVFQLLAGSLPFVAALQRPVALAVATLAATIAVARSPASAIAVLRELGGKGPFSALVMAVVVVKDALVFVAFSINIELARLATRSAAQGLQLSHLLQPLASVALAAALGAASGYLLTILLHPLPHPPSHGGHAGAGGGGDGWEARLVRWLAAPAQWAALGRVRPVALLAVSGLTFVAAEGLGAEPLLACVTAGLVVSNSRWGVDAAGTHEAAAALAADLGHLMPAVNAIFFGLVGASLRLHAMRATAWAATLLWGARLGGIWLGCASGAAIAGGLDPDSCRQLWMGMITQAGIALGLAQAVARRFPDWGPDLAALEAGVVLLNLAVGPPLFKAAVVAAGEARALEPGGGALLSAGSGGGGASGGGRGSGGGASSSHRDGRGEHQVKLIPIIEGGPLASLDLGEW
eukprot:scaffold16.g89.t1